MPSQASQVVGAVPSLAPLPEQVISGSLEKYDAFYKEVEKKLTALLQKNELVEMGDDHAGPWGGDSGKSLGSRAS